MQGACVENTLDSVIMSLMRDPNRKFIFAEMVTYLMLLLLFLVILVLFLFWACYEYMIANYNSYNSHMIFFSSAHQK